MSGDRLRVLVASEFLPEAAAAWSEAFDATFEVTKTPARVLAERGEPFEALAFSLDVPMAASVIDALPDSIRALATYSVGTDHIDLEAAERRGLAVFNTPGVLSDSVAENAIFLMLGAARRATESIDLIRSGGWAGWNPTQIVGLELAGRRLGILGLGDIGERIATRAQALGMEILYCNRTRIERDTEHGFEFRDTPEALMAESDVFLIACPSTPATRGLVDANLLRHARRETIVVNIARGDIVVDTALIEALREGRVWAAGLDVFAGEPVIASGYYDLPNVFMLPHIGSSTTAARMRMGRILIEALQAWRSGKRPSNQVV